MALAAGAGPIITFDAPGAGTGASQGTGCFAFTDCSVLINNFGAITGYFLDANNVYHGYLRSADGSFTTFDAPGADTQAGDFNGTTPNAINDAGAIAGVYYDTNSVGHGFLRSPAGSFATFDAPENPQGTFPIALNLESAVVGYYLNQNGRFRAFLRNPNGTIKTWRGPEAASTGAFDINVFGEAVGHYRDGHAVVHGFIRNPQGTLTSFDAPGAGTEPGQGTGSPGTSVAVNVFGATAGYYTDTNFVVHGFLRSPSGEFATFLPAAAGPSGTGCYADCPLGLNDWGEVTGYYLDVNNVAHGFLRTPEGAIITIDAPGADMTAGSFSGTFAVSINDLGVVTGYYIDSNNVSHGFLRLP